LLSFMLGATDTTKGPEVAPVEMVMLMEVALQELMVNTLSFSSATLLPCEAPNPLPEITTWLPSTPLVADTLLITGAGAATVLTDTLSKVAVASAAALPLVTAKPTYTFCAMLMDWLVPTCTQLTPSVDA